MCVRNWSQLFRSELCFLKNTFWKGKKMADRRIALWRLIDSLKKHTLDAANKVNEKLTDIKITYCMKRKRNFCWWSEHLIQTRVTQPLFNNLGGGVFYYVLIMSLLINFYCSNWFSNLSFWWWVINLRFIIYILKLISN